MRPVVETKKVCIYDDRVVIKRKNIILKKEEIKEIFYAKWTLKNYFYLSKCMTPGVVYIILSNPSIFRKWYCFRMKYDDVKKIPKKLCERIIIRD